MFTLLIRTATAKIRKNIRQNIPSRRIRTTTEQNIHSIYLNEKRHRVNGPAIVQYTNKGTIHFEHWFLHDKRYNQYGGPVSILYTLEGKLAHKLWLIDGQVKQIKCSLCRLKYY